MSGENQFARIDVTPSDSAVKPFVSEWISCDKRLPGTFSDEVVVVLGGWWGADEWVVRQCKFWRASDGSPVWEACDAGLDAIPTHWILIAMPPAKEEGR